MKIIKKSNEIVGSYFLGLAFMVWAIIYPFILGVIILYVLYGIALLMP